WTAYHNSPTIQKVIDAYFEKLSEHIPQQKSQHSDSPSKKEEPAEPKKAKRQREKKQPTQKPPKEESQEEEKEDNFELVERIPDELRFMRRYVNMHGKKKSKEDLLRFINA